jgi:hypothetical protein
MMRMLALIGAASVVAGCRGSFPSASHPSDGAFAQVQRRGAQVMGVDQYTSAHVFEDLPEGGRILLERKDTSDTAGIAVIRRHLHEVAVDFRASNFTKPFQVHAQNVPGTGVMAAHSSAIRYEVVDRPAGAELVIRTRDSIAVAAVHRFLAFQRSDHRAAGHEAHHN